jgi:hypothetical protein
MAVECLEDRLAACLPAWDHDTRGRVLSAVVHDPALQSKGRHWRHL